MIAGVCGGLGHYTAIDPVVYRVTFAVLALFGGAGLVLYAIAWLVLPDDGAAESEALRIVRGRATPAVIIAAVAALVGAALLFNAFDYGLDHGVLILVAVAIVAVIVASQRGRDFRAGRAASPPAPGDQPPAYQSPVPPPAPPPSAYQSPADPPYGPTAQAAWAPPPANLGIQRPDRRDRWVLGPLTVSLMLILAGVLLALGIGDHIGLSARALFASLLLLVGAGLVAGAWFGRSRGLIALGILLTIACSIAAVVNVPLRGSVGDRTWRVTDTAELAPTYRMTAGDGRVDLTGLDLAGRDVSVEASIGVGQLVVVVPADAEVVTDAHVGVGRWELFGQVDRGTSLERTMRNAPDAGISAGTIHLKVRAGVGELEVNRAAS